MVNEASFLSEMLACEDTIAAFDRRDVGVSRRQPRFGRYANSPPASRGRCRWHKADITIALPNVRFRG
jgi:hypothetical protein